MAAGDIPAIYDWADGQGDNYGTPAPAGLMNAGGKIGTNTAGFLQFALEEASDSPTIEVAEQATITHRFIGVNYTFGQFLQQAYPRGSLMTDNNGNESVVLSTNLQRTKGGIFANFTIVSEGQAPLFSNLPDEFSIEPIELNPALEKHPRYQDLTYKDRYTVRAAGQQLQNPDVSQTYKNAIDAISDPLAQQEAQELMYKMRSGTDSFYLSGYKVVWSQYFWKPQIINPGGYIEDPVYEGALPVFFWSTTQDVSGENIFKDTTQFNGNMYYPDQGTAPPWGLTWLRQMDQVGWQRTQWKVTRTWIGATISQWDNELYNPEDQPFQTSENQGALMVP